MAYFVYEGKWTDGFTEGINNKIKLIKRRAYGFRRRDRFKMRVMMGV